MTLTFRTTLAAAAVAATLGVLAISGPAVAQGDTPRGQPGSQDMQGGQMSRGMGAQGGMGMGMSGQDGMGGMMGMMGSGRMMHHGRAMHGLPRLPAGNEKLELQMHAEMMRAIGDILGKYAAQLPDRK